MRQESPGFECSIKEEGRLARLEPRGRIDGLTSRDLEKCLAEAVEGGERNVAVSLEHVTYLSSAGMRVFMVFHKKLRHAGGEIVFSQVPGFLMELLRTGGFDRIFRIVEHEEGIAAEEGSVQKAPGAAPQSFREITFSLVRSTAGKGTFCTLGSPGKLGESGYEAGDIVTVKQESVQFGAGLATPGERFDEFCDYFGEACIVSHNFFVYPAREHTAVDFEMYSRGERACLNFLYGFSFKGPFALTLSFEGEEGPIELSRLIEGFLSLTDAPLIGMVFLAESKGIRGLTLRRIPLLSRRPANGKDIFHQENFPEWFDFSLEPEAPNRLLLAVGIAAREKEKIPEKTRELFPERSSFHLHGCEYPPELLRREPGHFEQEIERIMGRYAPLKLRHLLGKSLFSYGLAGIVELEG
ncbi:MAG: STAS domain-containing protein [Candidatus Eremiobacteraeota bacterium]|nr:STAS domain-containing protein [Candidatus Eremiobacteraeota bacterium]